MSALYRFRPATLDDLPLLRRWIRSPHVRQWWRDRDPYDAARLADPRIACRIVSRGGRAFGYLQDYDVHGWGEHHFGDLPQGARGMDQFIGPAEMIGKGHGTGFIGQRMRVLFDRGAPVLAVDPHPDNARAIAAYEKAGFRVSGAAMETDWGRVLPMLAWRA